MKSENDCLPKEIDSRLDSAVSTSIKSPHALSVERCAVDARKVPTAELQYPIGLPCIVRIRRAVFRGGCTASVE